MFKIDQMAKTKKKLKTKNTTEDNKRKRENGETSNHQTRKRDEDDRDINKDKTNKRPNRGRAAVDTTGQRQKGLLSEATSLGETKQILIKSKRQSTVAPWASGTECSTLPWGARGPLSNGDNTHNFHVSPLWPQDA